jgi:hypothetical protein
LSTISKTTKIILAAVGLLTFGTGLILAFGMYSMEIEDTYGDNQDIFYNSRQGDMVINHDTKELGQITKTWKRFYVINHNDTLNINNWWGDKKIEIFRLIDNSISGNNLSYEEIDRLKRQKKIELHKRLW